MIQNLLRTWRTVRWLKPVQIYGRLWFRLYRPRLDLRKPPPRRRAGGTWWNCARAPTLSGPATFRLLGEERRIVDPDDWDRPEWPRLWRYHLHYFDDLVAVGAREREERHRSLIGRWLDECPPGRGSAWEPYPMSLRIVNWIKWLLAGHTPPPGMLDSLAVQVRFLRRRLEHHLQGNHLWSNLKALVFAGLFFEGEEAARWRVFALRLLRRELGVQVLGDGGHFERSPMYHALVLEDLLDLIQIDARFSGIVDAADVRDWQQAAGRMLRWLRVMTHPDGEIAFFNDAAMDMAPNLAALGAYAARLGVELDRRPLACLEELPDSGFVRMQGFGAVLIADVGSPAPSHQPGHAHAGTLSFELSMQGQRVLVNGGISTYEAGALRVEQRSTAAHNTVCVDGQDSSEVWSVFRVGRRARVFDVRAGMFEDRTAARGGASGAESSAQAWREPWLDCVPEEPASGSGLMLEAAHDGFRQLGRRRVHRRTWRMDARGLEVVDLIEGPATSVIARFRCHPYWELAADRLGPLRWEIAAGRATLPDGRWYPRFGASERCVVLKVAYPPDGGAVQFRWN